MTYYDGFYLLLSLCCDKGMKVRALSPLHRKMGAAIREHRTSIGLTQEDFAERIECRIAYVGSVERGQQNIRISTLDLFFAGLNSQPRERPALAVKPQTTRQARIALLEYLAKTLGLTTPHFSPALGSSRSHEKAHDEAHDTVNPSERRILEACLTSSRSAPDLLRTLGYTSRTGNFKRGLNHLIRMGLLELIMPDRPRSKNQKYLLTDKGKAWLVASHI
jgi:transcriptional regulator with XRE-family HTH domain